MIEHGDSVILGVSGGADSLCLLILLMNLRQMIGFDMSVVHVNHHIRGDEADADQQFVEKTCAGLGIICRTEHIDARALSMQLHCSEEEAGRKARYDIFEKVMNETGADKIAVAHNLGDSAETILFNLTRGSGIRGLRGISPVRGNIIRPLLCVSRDEIVNYLDERKINYRVDSTNLQNDYSRNKIRNNVITYLEENINSQAVANMVRAGLELGETDDYLEDVTDGFFERYVTKTDFGYFVSDNLENEHTVIKKRVIRSIIEKLSGKLKDVTRRHIESICDLYGRQTGKRVDLPYGLAALRTYDGISIIHKDKECGGRAEEKAVDEEKGCGRIVIYDGGKIQNGRGITVKAKEISNSVEKMEDLLYTKIIDCDMIKDSLVVRTRQQGDFITINDNGDRKKLKDYFIDKKIPREERDKVLLVADGSHIVWIVGYRMSAAYKISLATKNALELSFDSEGT